MPYDDSNVFARILRGEIPAKTVGENEYALAFHDIKGQAPVHVLVIPKGKYTSLADFSKNANAAEIAGLHRLIAEVLDEVGIVEGGFRAIANTGVHGGQEVPHFHVHLLGGKQLGRMLGD